MKANKRIIKRLSVGVFFIAAFQPAFAENWTWDSTYRTIMKIYPQDAGMEITIDGPTINSSSTCSNRLLIPLASPNYNVKIAALLAAYSQGRHIMINYDAGYAGCQTAINRFETEG